MSMRVMNDLRNQMRDELAEVKKELQEQIDIVKEFVALQAEQQTTQEKPLRRRKVANAD